MGIFIRAREMIDTIAGIVNEVRGSYSNKPGDVWLFITMVRVFLVSQFFMKYYEDGGLDKCASNNQRSPGCVNLCLLHYAPVSLCTFWMTSLKAVMLPFVLFRMLLNFVRVKNQYRADRDLPHTWLTRTRSLRRSNNRQYLWSKPIAICLIIKLGVILMLEIFTLYLFGWLQQFKYPERLIHPTINGTYMDYRFSTLLEHFSSFMIIPEGYQCDTTKVHETWFGTERIGRPTTTCHGVNSYMNCWVKNSVQKTFMNRTMVLFQSAAVVLMALELISHIVGHITGKRRHQTESDLDLGDVELTSPLSYHYPDNFVIEPEDEPRLYKTESNVKFDINMNEDREKSG